MNTTDRIALMQRYLGEATAEIEILKIERDAATERAFRASEALVMNAHTPGPW